MLNQLIEKSIFGLSHVRWPMAGMAIFLLSACGGQVEPGDVSNHQDAITTVSVIESYRTLKYEGSCNFLRNCSANSGGIQPPDVQFYCNPSGPTECQDSDLWLAMPSVLANSNPYQYCGAWAKVCNLNNGLCAWAEFKDKGFHYWEASQGLLDALGYYDYSDNSGGWCSGSGEIAVSLEYDLHCNRDECANAVAKGDYAYGGGHWYECVNPCGYEQYDPNPDPGYPNMWKLYY